MAKKPGRPSSDEIATESVRQANDASKIDVQTDDNETARLLKEANAILTQTAKTDLLKAAATNAKKAALEAKREAEEEYADMKSKTTPPTNQGFRSLPAGFTAADIREIASALPEEQREAFIRQSLGMPSGNSLINAFMQRTPTAQPVAATQTQTQQPMSFADMMQGMMGLMTMSMQLEQKKSEEWRQQQQYLEDQHRRRVEELREARGEVRETGPDPMVEAYKLQIEMLKSELDTNRAMIKELVDDKKDALFLRCGGTHARIYSPHTASASPSMRIWPCSSQRAFLQIFCTCSIEWETKTTVAPEAIISCMRAKLFS